MSNEKKPVQILDAPRFAKWVRKARVTTAVERITAELQGNPMLGNVIPGYGSLRKVRMAGAGRGKRGGFRVVYTLLIDSTLLVLLDGYSKSDKEDLSANELAALVARAAAVEAEVRAADAATPQSSEE